MAEKLTRRSFLQAASIAAAGMTVAACGPKPTEEPTTAPTSAMVEPTKAEATVAPATAVPQPGRCQVDWSPTLPSVAKKYDPNVVITTPGSEGASGYPEGYNVHNNPLYNEVKDNLGIEYKVLWDQGVSEKLMAAIAAGDVPDIFYSEGTQLAQLVEADALEEIREPFETYASDLVKQKKEYPDHPMWYPAWRGDKLYGVNFYYGPAYNGDCLGYIRQDWLDQLGLDKPETLDEMEEVMRQFKDKGLSAYGINVCKNLVTWYQSVDAIFGAYGVMPTVWMDMGDRLEWGSIQPGCKEALARLRQWYADGLINPDFYAVDEVEAEAVVVSEKAGIFYAPWWASNSVLGVIPNANWQSFLYPKGPEGKQGRWGSPQTGVSAVFRKGVEPIKVEAALNHLNWYMDKHVNFDKYHQYGETWGFVEYVFEPGFGIDFDEDCELQVGPIVWAAGYTHYSFFYPGVCYANYQADFVPVVKKWMEADPATLDKGQRYTVSTDRTKYSVYWYEDIMNTLDLAYPNRYLGNLTENMVTLQPELDKMASEYYIGIVTGQKPLDAFDEFVAQWKASGGDTITQEANAWYAEYK